jgi:hypothetical protein
MGADLNVPLRARTARGLITHGHQRFTTLTEWDPSRSAIPHGVGPLTECDLSRSGTPHGVRPLTEWDLSRSATPHGVGPLTEWDPSRSGASRECRLTECSPTRATCCQV